MIAGAVSLVALATTGVALAAVTDPGAAAGLEITDGPDLFTSATAATFAWTHDDADSTFTCRVDEGPFEVCISPMSVDGFTEGQHRFTVRALDTEGEMTAQEQLGWAVDLTPPTEPEILAIGASPTSIIASWRPSTDESRLAGYVVYLDKTARSGTIAVESFTFTQLTCSAHLVGIEAIDAAGNASRTEIEVPPRCAAPRPRCVVPGLVGRTLARATTLLAEANCRLGTVTRRYSFRPRGRVIRQSDMAGRLLPQGSRINLVVSRGPQS